MARERILITVKTYPTLSKTYGETVCTAGIREDGSTEIYGSVSENRPAFLFGDDAAISRLFIESVADNRCLPRTVLQANGFVLMPSAYTEDQLVEQPTSGLFAEFGLESLSAMEGN